MKETQFFNRELTYRHALLEMALTLQYFIDALEDRMFEIALTGELGDWIDTVPEEENHEIEIEVLQGCRDKNITEFTKFLNDVVIKRSNFMNRHTMDEKEVTDYEKFKFDSYWNDDDAPNES